MNEDPTIPIGQLTPPNQAERTEAPAPAGLPGQAATWGSFTLVERVGHGGFGEVYRAWDPHLQREVALKLLLPGVVGGEAEYGAMLREARALASVRHPNIVPVYGIDRHEGRVGFWTDFVRGKTLAVLVNEQGRFGAREAALIGLDVARALSAVHRAGLLHRDIKAENVMREEGGRILLMDFGLSTLEQRQTNIAGTPNYMAPELFEGGKSTVATDIYAMGVLLYFLVSGDYPALLGGMPLRQAIDAFSVRKPLMDLRPDLPESLLRTVAMATEIDPAKRFQSAGQLASALAESLGTTHAPVELPVAPHRLRPARKWIVPGLLAATAMGVGSLAWYGHRARQSHGMTDGASSMSAEAQNQFQKAQDLLLHSYKEANVADAIKGFEAVLKQDPNNALAEAELGDAHFVQYKVYNRGANLQGRAIAESDRARTLNPDLAAPYITLSRIAAYQGKTEEAMQWVDKAREKEPNSADVWGALGEVYEAQGKEKEAIEAYRKAADFAPEDWRWPMNLGVAEWGQGNNFDESIRQFQNAIRLANDNAIAYYDLSVAHMQSNRIDEAQKDLEKSIQLDPSARKYGALGSVLLLQGKYDDSVAMEKKALAMNPNDYDTWSSLGTTYRWSGKKPDLAAQAFRNAVALEESEVIKGRKDPIFLAGLAEDDVGAGNSEKGLAFMREALALDPANPTVEYKAGETYEALGQRSKAIPLIASALAHGYRVTEFQRNPELASLRADPAFITKLNEEKAKQK